MSNRIRNVSVVLVQFRLPEAAIKGLPSFVRVMDESKGHDKPKDTSRTTPRTARALERNGAAGRYIADMMREEAFTLADVYAKIRTYDDKKTRVLLTYLFARKQTNPEHSKAFGPDALAEFTARANRRFDQVTVDYLSGENSLELALGTGTAAASFRFLGNDIDAKALTVTNDAEARDWGIVVLRK